MSTSPRHGTTSQHFHFFLFSARNSGPIDSSIRHVHPMPFWNQRVEVQERYKRGTREEGKENQVKFLPFWLAFALTNKNKNNKKHKETQTHKKHKKQDAPIKTTKIARTNEAGIKFPVKPVS